jgi:HD-GYP domain-containing protein (c-di-GMP phosphodiesterase class II)
MVPSTPRDSSRTGSIAADAILQHHERMDGSGYPAGLGGDDISVGARIVAVADTVEAMASHRPYRAALGFEAALAQIEAGAGTTFDADVVDVTRDLFCTSTVALDLWRRPPGQQ